MDHAPSKKWAPVRGASICFGPSHHRGVQPVSVLDHVAFIREEGRFEQPHKHPEPEMVPLVRCGGEQKQVPAMGTKGFCQFVVFGLARLLAGLVNAQMMGLVEYHKVPGRRFRSLLPEPVS